MPDGSVCFHKRILQLNPILRVVYSLIASSQTRRMIITNTAIPSIDKKAAKMAAAE
jgi:hypothetical protein